MTLDDLFFKYKANITKKFDNFPKYTRRQTLARFLARYELFKKIQNVKGNIVECGVYHGGGVMSWAKFSTIFEPYALYRKVIGFDTFEGFPSIHENDKVREDIKNKNLKPKGLKPNYDVYEEMNELMELYNMNRYLSNFPKVELIKGDAIKTIPEYVENNKHLVISLLYLDFDLYEPTKIALEYLFPRVVKGGIVVFDETNNNLWPGETVAIMEKFGSFNNLKVQKFDFEPKLSYVIL
ncbi:hypothetical protein OSSY52_02990 [Tepiditoga spiralis]|uniref:dTDP-6-deoxy-L-hexose 3-O-methyltransferase n=1 Tax=Tepiditoga spiralis TaxID=2108365 RepID=A0A7G1G1X5_9BACT|nr:TylF/MycF/NovP-related O-methyltransferase [Tepiditoga spiralis]BBE30158.1 hypothetical protein OSSY52_02990 [Tepiditoga spiralis]